MTNMAVMAREIEASPRVGGDSHIHDLSHVFTELADLQKKDGGPQSAAFRQDLASLNNKLMHDGVLPSLQIMGIDNADNILTKNGQTGELLSQNANAVRDFGKPPDVVAASPLVSYTDAFKLPMTPGSDSLVKVESAALPNSNMRSDIASENLAKVESPADHADVATVGVLSKVFQGMVRGGDKRSRDTEPLPAGMNPLLAQAWSGVDENSSAA